MDSSTASSPSPSRARIRLSPLHRGGAAPRAGILRAFRPIDRRVAVHVNDPTRAGGPTTTPTPYEDSTPCSTPLRRLTLAGATSAALIVAAAAPATLQAQAANGYELVDPPQNTATADKVEVLEFFWLGCPHCYAFEPSIEAWAEDMPENVVLRREAPPLNRSWENHSRGFYAAQLLGHEHEFVVAMFEAIHEERKPMRDPRRHRRSGRRPRHGAREVSRHDDVLRGRDEDEPRQPARARRGHHRRCRPSSSTASTAPAPSSPGATPASSTSSTRPSRWKRRRWALE